MAVQIQGNGGTVGEVETNTRAYRVTQRPTDVGSLGAYSLGVITGVLGAGLGANSEIFQFRWTHATNLMLLRSIVISASTSTLAFVAGVPIQIEARHARTWSADGTGGTALVFSTANTNKKRTSFALSSASDTGVRIATTAALGAGTKTLDTNPFASLAVSGQAAAAVTLIQPGTYLWQRNTGDEYPVVYAQNEGFVVRSVAVPATGTWTVALTIEWQELASF